MHTKMINIIRNCSHFSEIHTGLKTDSNGLPISILKRSFSKNGVKTLLREFEGISEYSNILGIDSKDNIIDFTCFGSYVNLELKYHVGSQGNYMIPIDKNHKRMTNAIEYYKKYFYNGESSYSHGDFSISNIIFIGNSIEWIIDWENSNKIMPREYDLVYCITENCLSRFARNGTLTKCEILTYYDLLSKIDVDESIAKAPASWCRDVAIDYSNKVDTDHSKCPFISYSKDIVDGLDILLTEGN